MTLYPHGVLGLSPFGHAPGRVCDVSEKNESVYRHFFNYRIYLDVGTSLIGVSGHHLGPVNTSSEDGA